MINTAPRVSQTAFQTHFINTIKSGSREAAVKADLGSAVHLFKNAVFDCIEAEHKFRNMELGSFQEQIFESLSTIIAKLHLHCGPESTLDEQVKNNMGKMVRKELAPYLMMGNIPFRAYTKPRGYAGDFLTIAQLVQVKLPASLILRSSTTPVPRPYKTDASF